MALQRPAVLAALVTPASTAFLLWTASPGVAGEDPSVPAPWEIG
jgi:hypothetical protein